jgi:hypothetical protein
MIIIEQKVSGFNMFWVLAPTLSGPSRAARRRGSRGPAGMTADAFGTFLPAF